MVRWGPDSFVTNIGNQVPGVATAGGKTKMCGVPPGKVHNRRESAGNWDLMDCCLPRKRQVRLSHHPRTTTLCWDDLQFRRTDWPNDATRQHNRQSEQTRIQQYTYITHRWPRVNGHNFYFRPVTGCGLSRLWKLVALSRKLQYQGSLLQRAIRCAASSGKCTIAVVRPELRPD